VELEKEYSLLKTEFDTINNYLNHRADYEEKTGKSGNKKQRRQSLTEVDDEEEPDEHIGVARENSELLLEKLVEKESEIIELQNILKAKKQKIAEQMSSIERFGDQLSTYEAQTEILRQKISENMILREEQKEEHQEELLKVEKDSNAKLMYMENMANARIAILEEELKKSSGISGEESDRLKSQVTELEHSKQLLEEEVVELKSRLHNVGNENVDKLNESILETSTFASLLDRERKTESQMRELINVLQKRLLSAESQLFMVERRDEEEK
jgi:hypothetical protein